MKTALAIVFIAATVSAAAAQYGGSTYNPYGSNNSGLNGTGSNPNNHYVSPHVNSNGTSVGGHYQTNPNNTQFDNYGTRGNVNPYTGSVGTHTPRY